MTARDVSLLGFRLLAVWVVVSGLTALLEVTATWKVFVAQTMPTIAAASNAPTEGQLLWMTLSAMAARVGIGVVLWWVAPLLARHMQPDDAVPSAEEVVSVSLYSAATFLVGLWLLSEAIPALAYMTFVATRPGIPAYDDGNGTARAAESIAKLVVGVAFVKGTWLVQWATGNANDRPEEHEEPRDGG